MSLLLPDWGREFVGLVKLHQAKVGWKVQSVDTVAKKRLLAEQPVFEKRRMDRGSSESKIAAFELLYCTYRLSLIPLFYPSSR